jgi:hypothetical protein
MSGGLHHSDAFCDFPADARTRQPVSRLPWIGAAKAQNASRSFGPLKQVNTSALSIGYAEIGPADGPVAVLLHGSPALSLTPPRCDPGGLHAESALLLV